ncbi:MAG: hypothetical protein ACK4Z9_06765 [Thermodesulfovibrionales bacterium]
MKAATLWLKGHMQTTGMRIGYFGASTGTAAALRAAADPEINVRAIVSR